jgi:NTP pyrophosphatase (non-canonical NTP hydrolase)
MDIKEINKFSAEAVKILNKKFEHQTKGTEAFVTMLKITKKTGFLAGEVAKSFGFASKEHQSEPFKLDNEMAGVVLKIFVLAAELSVDMEAALSRKMEMAREKMKADG